MKTATVHSAPAMPAASKQATPWRTTPWWRTLRVVLGVVSWALFLLFLVVTILAVGWILLGLLILGSGPAADADISPVLTVLVLLLILGALTWVVARFFGTPKVVAAVAGSIILVALIAGFTWAKSQPNMALFVARDIAWGPSDVKDYEKFPQRAVNNAPPAYQFRQNLSPQLFQTIEYKQDGQVKQASLDDFLKSSHTTSFIVVKDNALLYEGYFNGYKRDSIVTSFSSAKSVTSALIGIAIDEGYIGSVDDPIVSYLPELRGKGLDGVTVRHLLLMASGITFVSDDEISGLASLSPISDDALSYSYPDLRAQALSMPADGNMPGTEFNYNNYNVILLGMILERTTHVPIAQYLQEKIWKPLGMEYPASWGLDSNESGFEATLCCVNARAIDFAKFGQLFLNHGVWNGKQIISEQWANDSTSPNPNPNGDIAWRQNTFFSSWKDQHGYYKYLWWGRFNADGSYDYWTEGHLAQYIYVSPQNGTVVARFGTSDEGVDSWLDVLRSVATKAK